MNAIAAQSFRGIARQIGLSEHARCALRMQVDAHQSDAQPELESSSAPREPQAANVAQHAIGNLERLLERAVLEQQAKLVAAESRERVSPSNAATKQGRDSFEQNVAGSVTGDIVDELELIEVDVS